MTMKQMLDEFSAKYDGVAECEVEEMPDVDALNILYLNSKLSARVDSMSRIAEYYMTMKDADRMDYNVTLQMNDEAHRLVDCALSIWSITEKILKDNSTKSPKTTLDDFI